jgi:hypothetical protein
MRELLMAPPVIGKAGAVAGVEAAGTDMRYSRGWLLLTHMRV